MCGRYTLTRKDTELMERFDIEEITAVPLLPHPMIPTLMAEFALDPKTIPGFKIIAVAMAALFFINEIRFI